MVGHHTLVMFKMLLPLVLDGAGYHKSKAVLSAADKLDIKLHTLPSYSPNLNPMAVEGDERKSQE